MMFKMIQIIEIQGSGPGPNDADSETAGGYMEEGHRKLFIFETTDIRDSIHLIYIWIF